MPVEQRVLLTGATGALGPSLAAQLLLSNPTRRLDVLFRRTSEPLSTRFEQFTRSVGRAMMDLGGTAGDWRPRVRPVGGDLRDEQLGLTRLDAAELRRGCRLIIHAAADTKFLSSIDDLRATNVEGTRRALDFARSGASIERVIQVSTVFTSGKRVGRITESADGVAPDFVNNYERTKWEAEQLALSSGVPVGIARVSIAIGSHASGSVDRVGAFHQMIKWFMRGLVPVIPGSAESPADLICTEVVARFIARAAEAAWTPRSIWHIAAGDQAGTLGQLSELAWTRAFPGQRMANRDHHDRPFIVDPVEWDQIRLGKTHGRQRLVRQAMDAISSFLPMFAYPRVYDTTHARKLWGGPLPHADWRQTLLKVIDAAGLAPVRREAAA